MIIDSSALMAVAFLEADRMQMLQAMIDDNDCRMSVATWLEACIVVDRRRVAGATARFETIVRKLGIELVPVSVEQATLAREAHRRFGRGNHPARLNYGDCFAYALAKITGEPLLFKGDDFSKTDIQPALTA